MRQFRLFVVCGIGLLWILQGCAWLPLQQQESTTEVPTERELREKYLNEKVFMIQSQVDGSDATCDFCTVVMDDLRSEAFLQTKSYVAASFLDPSFFQMEWAAGVMSRREFLDGFRSKDTMVVVDVRGSTLRQWLISSLDQNRIRQGGLRITVLLSEPPQLGSVLIERDILDPTMIYRIATTSQTLATMAPSTPKATSTIVWMASEPISEWLLQQNERTRILRRTEEDQRIMPID
jgi:hypothetical protein